jgi:YidC/Oxa1 family membrane protein insertase
VLVAALVLALGVLPAAAGSAPGDAPDVALAAQSPGPVETPFATPRQPPCPNPSLPPAPSGSAVAGATAEPTVQPNLCPATPTDPFALIGWIFTPLFQVMFLVLAFAYRITGDIGLAIIALTLLIRLLLYRPSRNQIVSSRRMQALAPEISALRQKYKGNQQKISEETFRLYKERGVNPFGCLPMFLTIIPLFVLYSVLSSGLSAPDISSMLQVAGVRVLDVPCQDPANALLPCINPAVHWLPSWQPDALTGNLLNASKPEILFSLPIPLMAGGFGISLLALISAALQLVQTRMMTPSSANADPQQRAMQRTFLILPLFSIFYGSFLPSGLFIYWIVTTVFSIVQQYLIAGWGSLFPLFGWTPPFARNHTPRFPLPPVPPPPVKDGEPTEGRARPSPTDRAAGTVRPAKGRARTSRRGRRR